MTASFKEVITSRIVTFKVGGSPGNSEYHVYERAITQLSDPLSALLTGSMSEAVTGCVVWDDVAGETFEAFVQFAYHGDYSVPQPEKSEGTLAREATAAALLARSPPTSPKFTDRVRWGKRKRSERNETTKGTYDDDVFQSKPTAEKSLYTMYGFRSRSYPSIEPAQPYAASCLVPGTYFCTIGASKNPTLAPLSLHASLHTLGTFYMIPSLQALSLHKLYRTLCSINVVYLDIVEQVVALVRCAYKDDIGTVEQAGSVASDDKGIATLRDMVCRFVIANKKEMMKEKVFGELLEEGGPLVRDLWALEVAVGGQVK